MNARTGEGSDLTGLTLAAIVLAMVAVALVPGKGTALNPQQQFGRLLTRYCRLWTTAAQADNPAVLSPLYAKDTGLVFYGLSEAEYRGWLAYGQGIKSSLFDNVMSLQLTPGDDFHVTKLGRVAWTTSILHVAVTWNTGRQQNFDAEQTAVWENRDGHWLIVHEHISTPVRLPVAVGS
ncbi:MAG: nuclear transport factor 2 family protein [Acidobacteriota bacterium]|nr:nuclear transport factor 2 family protein [Acidobacteriota bacterium]